VKAPISGPNAKYYRRLTRMSAAYSFLADFAMLFLGGGLKRKEMLSGRFADGLIHMYMASAVLKRFEDTGSPEEDQPLMEWSVRYCLFQTQVALDQILKDDVTGAIEYALDCVMAAAPAERKIKDSRKKQPYGVSYDDWLQTLVDEGVITDDEVALVAVAAEATHAVVMVDDFANEQLQAGTTKDHLGSYIQNPLAEAAAQKS